MPLTAAQPQAEEPQEARDPALQEGALLESADYTSLTIPSVQTFDFVIPRARGADYRIRMIEGSRGIRDIHINGADLSTARLNGCGMAGIDFSRSDLNNSIFEGVNFGGASFDRVNLSGAVFYGCSLRGSYLRGATLFDARFVECELDGANFDSCRFNNNTEFRNNHGNYRLPRELEYNQMYRPTFPTDSARTATQLAMERQASDAYERAIRDGRALGAEWNEPSPHEEMVERINQLEFRRRQPPQIDRDDVNTVTIESRRGAGLSLRENGKEIRPRTYRFGIEIEAYRPGHVVLDFADTNFGTDGSIKPPTDLPYSGFEARSMPKKYREMTKYVKRLSKYLISSRCGVNESCGLHLHTSHPVFFDRKYLHKLIMFWSAIEDVLISTQPKSRLNSHYCQRNLFQYITDYGMTIPEAKSQMIANMGNRNRYQAMNLAALESHGTIEIRLHAGTINDDKINHWITLIMSIYEYVRTNYNRYVAKELFDQEISDEKINKVFDLLNLPEETKAFYLERIGKFGWRRLKKQTALAKECIKLQKEKNALMSPVKKVDRKLQSLIKRLKGEKPIRRPDTLRPGTVAYDEASPSRSIESAISQVSTPRGIATIGNSPNFANELREYATTATQTGTAITEGMFNNAYQSMVESFEAARPNQWRILDGGGGGAGQNLSSGSGA